MTSDCSLKSCPDDCNGNGLCVDGVCHCADGFSGLSCGAACAGENGLECSGHGACLHGSCYCLPGWSGADCRWQACSYDCSAHGFCHNGTCACVDGFKGRDCSVPERKEGCECATKCTRTCLSKCTRMHEALGRSGAHKCYTECAAECHRGCEGGRKAELE